MDTITAPPRDRPDLTPFVEAPNANGEAHHPATAAWPLWQRVLFRFFLVYFLLQIEPWDWFRAIPGVSLVLRPYDAAWTGRSAPATRSCSTCARRSCP